MSLNDEINFDIKGLMLRMSDLWVQHGVALDAEVKKVKFAVPTDGTLLFCSYCNEKIIDIQSLSFDEVSLLRWASDCTHVPNLSSLIACMDDTDLASTLVDIIAIRKPRMYDFSLGSEAASTSREALTLGMAYSSLQQFVDARLLNFEKQVFSVHADVIRQELSETRMFLEKVHQCTVGSERIRDLLREEANRMVDLSSVTTMGWIVLGYVKVSIADNDLLRTQTVARALQASFSPRSLHDDEIAYIPYWVADAIATMAPGIIKSQFHMNMSFEVFRAAETLWREADGGIFADFDESVAAARRLN